MAFKRYDTIFDKIKRDIQAQEEVGYEHRTIEEDIIYIDD